MPRYRAIALSVLLLAVSFPVLSGIVADCTTRMHAAPSACCGSHCSCPASLRCVCRNRPAPSSPAPVQGALMSNATDRLAGLHAGATVITHPAQPSLQHLETRDFRSGAALVADAASDHWRDRLVTLQV